LPIKIFEISDVVFLDASTPNGARNERKISAMYVSNNSGFEIIQGLLDLIMTKIGATHPADYTLKADDDNKMYFPKRGASVQFKGKSIGSIGVLHPEVLEHFKIKFPVTCFEISLSELFDHFKLAQN
jgi:phenylalanyl-tRNA synthetase beta chain